MLWLLIVMRYRLIWADARARSRAGLWALYVAGVLFSMLCLLAGFAAAFAGVHAGLGAAVARRILAAILANSLVLGLAMGRGVHAAFSDAALRRFPFSRIRRMAIQLVAGLLDPVSVFSAAALLGVVAGFHAGPATTALGLGAAALFLVFCRLATSLALSVVETVLRCGARATALYGAVLALFVGTAFLLPVATRGGAGLLRGLDAVLEATPAGIAGSVISAHADTAGAGGCAALLGWCAAAGALLFAVERRRDRRPAARARRSRLGPWCEGLSAAFGSRLAPLVSKALLYHLRCDRVRFNTAVAAPLMVFLPVWMGRSGSSETVFLIQLALFFVAPALATNVLMMNQFGCDGAGIERYRLLPGTLGGALRAGSIASLLVGGAVLPPGMLLWSLFPGPQAHAVHALMLAFSFLAGACLFNALGLWTTLLAPRPVPFQGIAGTQLSWQANVALAGGLMTALGAAFVAAERPARTPGFAHGWCIPAAAAMSGLTYLVSLYWSCRRAEGRRQEVTCRIRMQDP